MQSRAGSQAVLLMGVSGSGKTTIGEKLAAALGWSFRDADSFHPAKNVAKMSAGHSLTDEDRGPWLAAIRAYLEDCMARRESTVVTCSALKEKYRDAIISDPARTKLVFLQGDFDLIQKRMEHREHFMKASMLKSQFETLEPPRDALVLDIAHSPEALVAEVRRAFEL